MRGSREAEHGAPLLQTAHLVVDSSLGLGRSCGHHRQPLQQQLHPTPDVTELALSLKVR